MNKKQLVFVLVAGIFIGYFFNSLIGIVGVVTSPHQQIISRIMIKEPDYNLVLTYSCAGSRNIVYGSLSFSFSFTPGKTYPFSTWIFSREGGDAEVALTIVGPGDDGHTYDVEVGRLTTQAFDVYVGDVLMLRFARLDAREPGVQYLGFAYFQIGT